MLGINYGEVTPSSINPALLITSVFACCLGILIVLHCLILPLLFGRRRSSHSNNRISQATIMSDTTITGNYATTGLDTSPPLADANEFTFQNPLYLGQTPETALLSTYELRRASMTDPDPPHYEEPPEVNDLDSPVVKSAMVSARSQPAGPAATAQPATAVNAWPNHDEAPAEPYLTDRTYLKVYNTESPAKSDFSLALFLRGTMSVRLGFLDMSAGDLLVLGLMLLANILCLVFANNINALGYAINFGYLAIGNSLLVVVPATRNSVLGALVIMAWQLKLRVCT